MINKKGKKFAEKSSFRPEIGASGTTNFQGVIDSEEYVSDLTGATLYKTVDKMRWSDASVQAALLMCELPIRSAEWDIESASESAEDKKIADFVYDNLFNGLTIPWEDTLRQILLMNPYGVMAFEVIYKLNKDGTIGWRKWAPRLPKTIERWNINENGELKSITQRTYKGNEYVVVEIPTEKLLIFVNRREGDNYLGTSILRQAYKHWFFRDKYYKIDAVAQERLGIGIPVITLPDGYTDDDYTAAENMGKNLRGHEKAYVVKKTGWEVEMMDLKANSVKSPTEMLEHHTREILKSVLAQFADLGSKAGGSYALSKDQTSFFLSSLDASTKIIEDAINKEIVKLVDYNFNVEEDNYPILTHSDLGQTDTEKLANSIQALVMSNVLTPDPKLEDYLRKVLNLPDRPEDVQPVAELKRKQEEQNMRIRDEMAKNAKNQQSNFQPNKQQSPKASEYSRKLTRSEMRVKFDEIRDYMDNAEKSIISKITSILAREKNTLLPLFEDAIRRKDFADLHRISLKLKGTLSAVFRDEIKELFEFGKLKASYEIKQGAPITTAEINKRISERAYFLTNFEEKKLLTELKGTAAVAMMNPDVTDEEAMKLVQEGFDKFVNRNIVATASLMTSDEINNGRKYTFDTYKDELYGYQWSAILDPVTCNYCTSVDGRVIGTEDMAFSEYKPGNVHFGCRCIWVGIMKEEENPPPFTGIPENLRPQSAVAPWEFKDLEYPLAGSGKRKEMPYGLGVYKEKKNI